MAYGDHSFDDAKFPKVKELIDEIHAYGSNVTLWVTPFINSDPIESGRLAEGREKNCFVQGIQRDGEEVNFLQIYEIILQSCKLFRDKLFRDKRHF